MQGKFTAMREEGNRGGTKQQRALPWGPAPPPGGSNSVPISERDAKADRRERTNENKQSSQTTQEMPITWGKPPLLPLGGCCDVAGRPAGHRD